MLLPWLMPESTRSTGRSLMTCWIASSTQSVGVPSTAKWHSPSRRMRKGRFRVSECPVPLWFISGATTQTSSLSWRAMRSSVLMPVALMPSSLATRMRGRSRIGGEPLEAARVGPQRLGHGDAAVPLLVVLQYRDQRPPDRQPRPVQRVHEARSLRVLGTVAGAHAPPLVVAAVGAGRDLAVGVLPRQPDLEVVGLARGRAGVARAEQDDAVRQPEALQHGLRAGGQPLVLGLALLRQRDAHQLDLGELVLPDHAARVLARGAGLRAEAGRAGRDADGQRRLVQDLARDEVGERDLGGRDQPVAVRGPERILGELRQLAGAEQRLLAHPVG